MCSGCVDRSVLSTPRNTFLSSDQDASLKKYNMKFETDERLQKEIRLWRARKAAVRAGERRLGGSVLTGKVAHSYGGRKLKTLYGLLDR